MGRPKQFDPDLAVERAMEVFWSKGYAATTPQDLVDALGIGKGSLYNTFGSKRELFERALCRYRDGQALALVELLEADGPVKELLRRTLRLLAEMDLADPGRRGCMAVNTAAELGGRDEEAVALVRRMFDRTEDAFRALIEKGQRTGEIAAGRDARGVGSLLLNTVIGLRLMARVADGPERLDRVIDAVIDGL
ncbi:MULTISPECIES: TetR/AcrR family transcriptional regulator [Streptomyces]|uniref:TetR/AcrR family transcriptional regulator n=1 Tax=Streptomyces TaxID=1883 RepID=UPI00163D0C40|nr:MULTISPECIES: TetR/AcrR family transcriptional regulator [Streptomyces]MBC2873727.1 TetR/AcrR family transcriptional regulator [Streptomyces sp. TYQ1024]UBI37846.1 TetR/AcrR family transcriptional regulator [Streptomyces mobaraensis]UKW30434.1 TetR/AcrR family transcriptional regulator [Streptomyces sp. TYQ1024]